MGANSGPGWKKHPQHRITTKNCAWSYEAPYDEMAAIKDRLAFYPDKVDSISAAPE